MFTLILMHHIETGMVEALAQKTVAWENERGVEFTYDGV